MHAENNENVRNIKKTLRKKGINGHPKKKGLHGHPK